MNRSLLAALALAAAASPAGALTPIDDCEIGGFSLVTLRYNNCVADTLLLNSYEPHCISQVRIVSLCGAGDNSTVAYLDPGSELDDVIRFIPGGNAVDRLDLDYRWGYPRTLTYGGQLNRIEVDLGLGLPGAHVTVFIGDSGDSAYATRDADTQGILTFPFSEFSGVSLEQAHWIKVRVTSSDVEGAIEIADIRLRGDGHWGPARTVNFTGDFVAIEVPPVPSPPLSFRMTDPGGHWLYGTNVTITRAQTVEGEAALLAEWSETAALGGEIGGVIFMGIEPQPFRSTDFELTVDLGPAIRLGPAPQIIGEPVLAAGEAGFLITFPVMLTDQAGGEIGRSETRILFDVHGVQPLVMADVQLVPGGAQKTGGGFAIAFSVAETGEVDESAPLFDATWIADWSEPGVTGVGDAPPDGAADAAPTLAAWPSVTRGETEIRASVPFGAPSVVVVHDAGGRLVRRIAAPAGATSLRWDGRDERGARVPSGLYFARANRYETAARIICVR